MGSLFTNPMDAHRFLTKATVSKESLVEALDTIGLTLRGSQMGKVFSIEYKDEVMTLRASSSLNVEIEIDVVEHPKEEFEIVCAYTESSSLLGDSTYVEIILSSEYVIVSGHNSEISFRTSVASVPKLEDYSGELADVQVMKVVSGLKSIVALGSLHKVYPTHSVIQLKGNVMQLRTPTIWVEVPSSGLNVIMNLDVAKVISKFANGLKGPINVIENTSYLIFEAERSRLFIPRQSEPDIEPLEVMTKAYAFAGTLHYHTDIHRVKDVARVVGPTDVKIAMYDRGFRIVAETNEMRVDIPIGATDNHFITFNMRLEFLSQLLSLLGPEVLVSISGSLISLKGKYASVIVATN